MGFIVFDIALLGFSLVAMVFSLKNEQYYLGIFDGVMVGFWIYVLIDDIGRLVSRG